MTRILSRTVACALCGRSVEVPWLVASHRLGAADLDTRPPFMERGTIAVWVAECPGCGYCAYDLSTAGPQAAEVVKTPEYLSARKDPSRRAIANRFLCAAMALDAAGAPTRAFWAAIHAAWVCDDDDVQGQLAGQRAPASECRMIAVEYAARARKEGLSIESGPGAAELVLSDVLRRAGRFGEARGMVRLGIEARPEAPVERLLAFEKRLIARKDVACHTEDEATSARK